MDEFVQYKFYVSSDFCVIAMFAEKFDAETFLAGVRDLFPDGHFKTGELTEPAYLPLRVSLVT